MSKVKITGLTQLALDELGQSDIDQLQSMIPCDVYFNELDNNLIMMPDKITCHVDYLVFEPYLSR